MDLPGQRCQPYRRSGSERPRIELERIAFDHKLDLSALRMHGVEQQVALKWLDKRWNPKPQAGPSLQPFIPQGSGQSDVGCPSRRQAEINQAREEAQAHLERAIRAEARGAVSKRRQGPST